LMLSAWRVAGAKVVNALTCDAALALTSES